MCVGKQEAVQVPGEWAGLEAQSSPLGPGTVKDWPGLPTVESPQHWLSSKLLPPARGETWCQYLKLPGLLLTPSGGKAVPEHNLDLPRANLFGIP